MKRKIFFILLAAVFAAGIAFAEKLPPCNGLPDKFGLAHVIVFQPLGKVGVFFLGHAGFDHMATVGWVIFFLQALTSFLARQGA